MTKYIIRWDAGYGDSVEIIEAESHNEAQEVAAESWNEEIQANADYEAKEFTLENAHEHDLEEQHPDYKGEDDE